MSAVNNVWKQHTVDFAWPTVALFVVVVAGHIAVWGTVLLGLVSVWVGCAIQTLLSYLAFTVAHEAAHGNIHGNRSRLRGAATAMGWIASVLLLAPFSAFRALHLQHHAHVNEGDSDPDHWVAGSSAASIAARCATIMPYYYYTLLIGPLSKTRAGRKARRSSVLTMVAFVAAGVVFVLAGLGVEALLLWALPALIASGVLAFAFDWLPHHPHDGRERYHDTRVILGPGLPLATMWQSYHLVHHLYPRVPFYRYGTCFVDLRPDLEARGADIVDLLHP